MMRARGAGLYQDDIADDVKDYYKKEPLKRKKDMKRIVSFCLVLLLSVGVMGVFNPAFAGDQEGWVNMTDGWRGGQFDFSGAQQYPQPFVDQNGRTMFPLMHFDEIFREGLRYTADQNTITITKTVLDVTTVINMTIDSNVLIKNDKEIIMDTTPIEVGEVVYISLRWVGEALGYSMSWWDRHDRKWPGGEVRFMQCESAFIYTWNENEDSSPEGLRYSYSICEPAADSTEIKANATSDLGQVIDVIKQLPRESKILANVIYYRHGYKILRDTLDIIKEQVTQNDNLYQFSYGTIRGDVIPPIIKDLDDYKNDWYTSALFSFDEKAIYDIDGQTYRFMCFPSFDQVVVGRIEINEDGTAEVYCKKWREDTDMYSEDNYAQGQVTLDKEETRAFLDLLDSSDYWNQPAEMEHLGKDGYDMFVEGVKDGTYHIVDRWSPRKDDLVSVVYEYLFEMIKQKFGRDLLVW